MNEVISVIVPVYNVSQYLQQCIESICHQSYQDLDIILVDDGSTDQSGILCDKYAEQDKRIRVIHQKNLGISEARNAGLDIAQGQFVAFIDSDDYIDEHMFSVMINEMNNAKADIVICNFSKVDENSNIVQSESPISNELLTGVDILHKLKLENFWYYIVVWNRLYRREIFEVLRFTPKKMNEDDFIFYDIFRDLKNIVTLQNPLYFYRNRKNSIMNATVSTKRLDGIEAAYLAFKKCEIENKDLLIYMYYFGKHQIKNISLVKCNGRDDKKRITEIRKMFRYMFLKTHGNKNMRNILQAFYPMLYYTIRKIVKKK